MKNVEDLYPLTPMQQAMLLRARGAGSSDALFQQFDYEWHGPLDEELFEASWRGVIARHPGLRTAFHFEGVNEPLQIVREQVPFAVHFLDWRSAPARTQEHDLGILRRDDRARPLSLTKAPLMRVTAVRVADATWRILWSSHHLIMDRWCIGVILTDFTASYAEGAGGSPAASVAAPGRFRDYVAWIAAKDKDVATRFWRHSLAGIQAAKRQVTRPARGSSTVIEPADGVANGPTTGPTIGPTIGTDAQVLRAVVRWDAAATTQLREMARDLGATPSAVIQVAWAATIAASAGSHRVAFGVTVAGRPHDVPGVENAVGSFIGNVPVIVEMGPSTSAADAIKALMGAQRDRAGHEYLSPTDLHQASGLGAEEPLFDSLFVWLSNATWEGPEGVSITQGPGELETGWPLTVGAKELEDGLELSLALRPGFELALDLGATSRGASLDRWLDRFHTLCLQLVAGDPLEGTNDTAPVPAAGSPAAIWSMDLSAEEDLPAASSGREKDSLEMVQNMLDDECRRLLGHERIHRELGFFEQGGNSLLAAALHGRLEAATGRSIPILDLFGTGNLDAMARRLHSGSWPVSSKILRPVRPRGTKPPLICVSSPEVNSVGYVNLARHLPNDQPVLLAQGPPDTDVVFRMAVSDIPKLAERYVDAILKSIPDVSEARPVRLLGMCDGALLSIQMARIFKRRGIPIDFVGSLNSFALGTLTWRFKLRRVGSRMRYYRARLGQVLARPRPSDEPAPAPVPALAVPAPTPQPAAKERKQHTQEHLATINHEWFTMDTPAGIGSPERFDGTVTLFRIRQQPYWRVRTRTLGWERHAASVQVIDLEDFQGDQAPKPGRGRHEIHLDMLREPDVQRTARAIVSALARLDAARPAPAKSRSETRTEAPPSEPNDGPHALAGSSDGQGHP